MDLVGIIDKIVSIAVRIFGGILMGLVAYRVLTAYSQDNEIKIWKAIFWGFIAFGMIMMGPAIGDVFKKTWETIVTG